MHAHCALWGVINAWGLNYNYSTSVIAGRKVCTPTLFPASATRKIRGIVWGYTKVNVRVLLGV